MWQWDLGSLLYVSAAELRVELFDVDIKVATHGTNVYVPNLAPASVVCWDRVDAVCLPFELPVRALTPLLKRHAITEQERGDISEASRHETNNAENAARRPVIGQSPKVRAVFHSR